jgi:4-hydroxy-3-methylbut-2-enyl diphosphate reductase
VALKAGAPEAHLIADASEINIELLDNADIIALSAGASAPEILVDEVRDLLESRYQLTIEYQNLISENMQFKLPSILTKA